MLHLSDSRISALRKEAQGLELLVAPSTGLAREMRTFKTQIDVRDSPDIVGLVDHYYQAPALVFTPWDSKTRKKSGEKVGV